MLVAFVSPGLNQMPNVFDDVSARVVLPSHGIIMHKNYLSLSSLLVTLIKYLG
jgi:hypothetical protein